MGMRRLEWQPHASCTPPRVRPPTRPSKCVCSYRSVYGTKNQVLSQLMSPTMSLSPNAGFDIGGNTYCGGPATITIRIKPSSALPINRVAQVGNLLCRRLAVGDTADCHSALHRRGSCAVISPKTNRKPPINDGLNDGRWSPEKYGGGLKNAWKSKIELGLDGPLTVFRATHPGWNRY